MTQFFPGDRVSFKFYGEAQLGNITKRAAYLKHTYDVLVSDGGDWFVTSQNENNLTFLGRDTDVQALIDATTKVNINTGTIKASDVLKVYGFGKGDKVRSKSSRLTGHVIGFRTDHEIQVELLSGTKLWLAHYEIEHVPTTPAPKAGSGFKDGDVVYVGPTEDSELAPFVFKDGNFTPAVSAPKPKFKIGNRVNLNKDLNFDWYKGDLGTVTAGPNEFNGYDVKFDKNNEETDFHESHLDAATPLTDHAKDLTRYFKTKYNLTDKTQVGYDLGTLAMLVEKLAKKVEEK